MDAIPNVRPKRTPRREPMDRGAVGLAIALLALAVHALATLMPAEAGALDVPARAVAFILLPGWALSRRLSEPAGTFETTARIVGFGTAVAGAASLLARAAHLPSEAVALGVAVLSLVSLAPRPGTPRATAPAGTSTIAAGLAGAVLGALGLALATSTSLANLVRPLGDLLSPLGDGEAGARAAGILCALLLATSVAALVRRWTHSAAAAGAAAILLAAGAGSMVFAKARPVVSATNAPTVEVGTRR